MPQFDVAGKIAKVDTERGWIFGWASVANDRHGNPVVDSQGDVIDIYDLEKAGCDFTLESRIGREMHVRKGVARLITSMVFTPEIIKALELPDDAVPQGWFVGFQVDDTEVLAKARSGEYSSFSIGGTGVREKVEEVASDN